MLGVFFNVVYVEAGTDNPVPLLEETDIGYFGLSGGEAAFGGFCPAIIHIACTFFTSHVDERLEQVLVYVHGTVIEGIVQHLAIEFRHGGMHDHTGVGG